MASPLDKRVIFGLVYLWTRDAKLPLTPKTARYINEHLLALLGDDEVVYSDDEIVEFIEGERLVSKVVHRLRQVRPVARLSRYQRDTIYRRRRRPRARVVALDKG